MDWGGDLGFEDFVLGDVEFEIDLRAVCEFVEFSVAPAKGVCFGNVRQCMEVVLDVV